MAPFVLEPVSHLGPSASASYLQVSFRLPGSSVRHADDLLHPASGLQLSFENGDHEAFTERLTTRDVLVSDTDSGLYSIRVPETDIPKFQARGAGPTTAGTTIKLHAWQGEKLLGSWNVGDLE